jgi:hypothetical protein
MSDWISGKRDSPTSRGNAPWPPHCRHRSICAVIRTDLPSHRAEVDVIAAEKRLLGLPIVDILSLIQPTHGDAGAVACATPARPPVYRTEDMNRNTPFFSLKPSAQSRTHSVLANLLSSSMSSSKSCRLVRTA